MVEGANHPTKLQVNHWWAKNQKDKTEKKETPNPKKLKHKHNETKRSIFLNMNHS